jgi:tRNA pseudouridine65 synthase
MLQVLHRDNALVAVSKPAGMLVHRTGLDRYETVFAMQLLRDQLGKMVWPLHRLDKGTSGILLFALSASVAKAMSEVFALTPSEHGLEKTYHAVVRGWPLQTQTIEHALKREDETAQHGLRRQEVQSAVTHATRLSCYALPLPDRDFPVTRAALMELKPQTGRRHQLRRHMKHIAHPIVGDATHGKGPLNRALAQLAAPRLWLHASYLSVPHPDGGQLRLNDSPGTEWAQWVQWEAQGSL